MYFASIEGDFHLIGPEPTRRGVWAGLFVTYPLRVSPRTR